MVPAIQRKQLSRIKPKNNATFYVGAGSRATHDDRKLLQILLILVSAPYLCLLMVTAGPWTVRFLISVFRGLIG
jgi:hypothetical protein